jgi:hypothetical protein
MRVRRQPWTSAGRAKDVMTPTRRALALVAVVVVWLVLAPTADAKWTREREGRLPDEAVGRPPDLLISHGYERHERRR